MVLSHQHPEQVLRLVRTLRRGSPESTIVLHHDDRRTRVDEAALRALNVARAQLTSVGRDDGLGLLELDCLLVREDAG